jgi:hypothetical protein
MLRWTLTVGTAEAAGFLAPAVAGVASVDLPAPRGQLLVLAAGAVEGAVLGCAQAAALHRALPALRRARWVGLTAAAVVVAYLLGLAPASFGSGWHALPAYAVVGALILLSVGGAQWLELRHHVPGADGWVWWTAVAWLAAIAAFLGIATPLWHEGQPVAAAVAIGAGAGVVMAAVQAAVTGSALVRLLARLDRAGPPAPHAPVHRSASREDPS